MKGSHIEKLVIVVLQSFFLTSFSYCSFGNVFMHFISDVVNIRKLDLTELHKSFKSMDFSHVGLHSGFMFQVLNRKIAFMCSNKRDFRSLGYLIEAIYSIRLPF